MKQKSPSVYKTCPRCRSPWWRVRIAFRAGPSKNWKRPTIASSLSVRDHCPFEEQGQIVQCVAPGIALVGDEFGDYRYRARLPARRPIVEATQNRRCSFESSLFGQKLSDLNLGIHSFIQPAEYFQ